MNSTCLISSSFYLDKISYRQLFPCLTHVHMMVPLIYVDNVNESEIFVQLSPKNNSSYM